MIKLLGVVLDASLTFEKHVLYVVRGCHFHIRALRHIRPFLTLDAAKTFAVAIVSSRLDSCNSLLQGRPTSTANFRQTATGSGIKIACSCNGLCNGPGTSGSIRSSL